MGWRLWVAIAIVVILVVAGVAYVVTRPAGGPARDRTTIVYYMQSEPVTFDSADAYDLWSFVTLQNTYDTLVGYDRDTLTLVPDLATSWTVTPDGMQYTFNLRHNVKFADNSSFTANDVFATFKHILVWGAPTTGVDWIINQNLNKTNIKGAMWVKDAYTIQMNLTQAYAGFLKTLATVEPAAIMSASWIAAHAPDRPGNQGEVNAYIKSHSMGTGPYVLDSWTKGSEMVLVQNKYFWRNWSGTEPTKIVLKFTTDATSRVEAIRTKSADIADLPLTNVNDVKNITGVIAKGNDTVKSEIVAINATNPDFVDKRVRQALSWAFDYNGTIANAYAGFASLQPGPIPKGMQFFDVQRQWYYQNLTKAQALLDASGHPKATSGPNAGYRFNGTAFRLVADGSQLEERQTAQLYQTTLQSIGIKTTLTIAATTDAWDTIRGNGAYDLFVAHWVLDYLDADDYVTPMVVSAANGGDYWTTGFVNATIDQYAVAAKSEQSVTQRAADYQIVWQTAMDNPNMIWFCQQQYVPVHQDYIHGFWFNPVTWYNFYFYQKT
jgi:peptide/nickel transport system substrate-binding protein